MLSVILLLPTPSPFTGVRLSGSQQGQESQNQFKHQTGLALTPWGEVFSWEFVGSRPRGWVWLGAGGGVSVLTSGAERVLTQAGGQRLEKKDGFDSSAFLLCRLTRGGQYPSAGAAPAWGGDNGPDAAAPEEPRGGRVGVGCVSACARLRHPHLGACAAAAQPAGAGHGGRAERYVRQPAAGTAAAGASRRSRPGRPHPASDGAAQSQQHARGRAGSVLRGGRGRPRAGGRCPHGTGPPPPSYPRAFLSRRPASLRW